MPRIAFTQHRIDALKPPDTGNVTYWDSTMPGFGLRLSSKDRRTWLAMYRVGQRQVMETLGTTAQVRAVADARNLARASITKARDGQDPVEAKRVEAAKSLTFGEVAERYLREYADRNTAPKTAAEVRRIINHDIIPVLGVRPIRDITRADVNDLLDRKASRRERPRKGFKDGAGMQSNRMLAHLKHLFKWSRSMDLVESNPCDDVMRRVKEVSRDRALTEAEIVAFWTGCDRLGWPFGPLLKLLLVTAQRREEVTGATWEELNLEKQVWSIPGGRTKNSKAHEVYLSPLAIEILQSLPRIGPKSYVFTTTGNDPVSGHSRAKTRLDKLMGDVAPWRVHDLRRTATTGMAGLGIAPHVVDKLLNHTGGSIQGVAAVYNRFQYQDEGVAALTAWGRYLEGLVRGSA